ncbi:MAG TPA: PGPGW domain-containing protein [Rubricoccaceae bacterium]|jgi:uncharacterized protein (TIGR02611 family)
MFDSVKRQWREVRSGEPGSRFQDQYERRQKSGRSPVRKGAVVVAGLVVLACGVFLLPAPGPGFLVVAIGAALVAEESLVAARASDWTEVRLRRLASGALRVWGEASPVTRGLLVLVALALAGGAGWATYELVLAR